MAIDERTGEVFFANQTSYGKRIDIDDGIRIDLRDVIHRPGSLDLEEVEAMTDAAVQDLEADEKAVVRGWVRDAVEARPYTV